MVQFPLVRWSVIVCSYDDIGTQAYAMTWRNEERKPEYVGAESYIVVAMRLPLLFYRNGADSEPLS